MGRIANQRGEHLLQALQTVRALQDDLDRLNAEPRKPWPMAYEETPRSTQENTPMPLPGLNPLTQSLNRTKTPRWSRLSRAVMAQPDAWSLDQSLAYAAPSSSTFQSSPLPLCGCVSPSRGESCISPPAKPTQESGLEEAYNQLDVPCEFSSDEVEPRTYGITVPPSSVRGYWAVPDSMLPSPCSDVRCDEDLPLVEAHPFFIDV